jgi:NAD(P)-dependent dehydrogenase (short-subunit alcohol dehydrogenase family)
LLNPEDLISTIDYLISEKSDYVNGQNIIVDDGWSL